MCLRRIAAAPIIMHKLFCVAELVELIVQNVTVLTSPRKRSRTHLSLLHPVSYKDVKSLGLTAKVFREPSLNAIWREAQCSLFPLLRAIDLVGGNRKHGYVRPSFCLLSVSLALTVVCSGLPPATRGA